MIVKTILTFLSLHLLTLGFSENGNADGFDGLRIPMDHNSLRRIDFPKHESSVPPFRYSFDPAKPLNDSHPESRHYLMPIEKPERVGAKKDFWKEHYEKSKAIQDAIDHNRAVLLRRREELKLRREQLRKLQSKWLESA